MHFQLNRQEHNFYKLFFLTQKSYLLQFVNLTCFSYFLICVIFSPSDCRLTAIFMGKWLILYERSVTKRYDQAIKFCMHCLEMCT